MVFGEDLLNLLLQAAEHLGEKALFLLFDLLDIELFHDLAERAQQLARVVDLVHVHAAQDLVGALCNVLRDLLAERNNGLLVADVDCADEVVHLFGVHELLAHLLPLGDDVVNLLFRRAANRVAAFGILQCHGISSSLFQIVCQTGRPRLPTAFRADSGSSGYRNTARCCTVRTHRV